MRHAPDLFTEGPKMDEELTAEQQATQERLLQSMISELETKIAPIKELDKLSKRCDGMFRVGARGTCSGAPAAAALSNPINPQTTLKLIIRIFSLMMR